MWGRISLLVVSRAKSGGVTIVTPLDVTIVTSSPVPRTVVSVTIVTLTTESDPPTIKRGFVGLGVVGDTSGEPCLGAL